VSAFVGAIAVAQTAFAATTSTSVTTFRNGAVSQQFPGSGSGFLSFASGSESAGSTLANATASAGQGRLSVFATAGNFGGGANSARLGASAAASLTDSFTITADSNVPLKLEFGMAATGSITTVYGPGRWEGFGPRAEVRWNIGLSGGNTSLSTSGRLFEAYRPVLNGGILVAERVSGDEGLTFREFSLVAEVGNGQIGQSFSLSMSASVNADSRVAPQGQTFSAVADFGNTLRWMGLRSVTLPDGTPYTGALSITSESGFDYTTPTPGAVGLALSGAAIFAGRRRRL
jgi:hypothetical protein